MKLYEELEVDFSHMEEKGCLVQLVHEGFSQVNVLESKKGCIRGKHYHKVSREAFFVADGMLEVTLSRDEKEETAIFKKGDFFCVPPFTYHVMRFMEDCILVALYDIPVENPNGSKDIYRKGES